MSEEEGPDNQHEVEGVEGRQRGERYKGQKWGGGCCGGGGGIKGSIMIVFLNTITLSDKVINMKVDILGGQEDTARDCHLHLHHSPEKLNCGLIVDPEVMQLINWQFQV